MYYIGNMNRYYTTFIVPTIDVPTSGMYTYKLINEKVRSANSSYSSVWVKVRRRFVRTVDWLVVAGGVEVMVSRRFDFLHLGVETVFVVSGISDHSGGTVGFQQAVRAFDVSVSVVRLVMALDVVGVWVVHGVLEVVRCGCVGVLVVVFVHVTVVFDDRRRVG